MPLHGEGINMVLQGKKILRSEREPDQTTQTQIAVAELAEVLTALDLENKLAIAELAEAVLGGET